MAIGDSDPWGKAEVTHKWSRLMRERRAQQERALTGGARPLRVAEPETATGRQPRPVKLTDKQLEAIQDRSRENWNKAVERLAPEPSKRARRPR